MRRQVRPCRDSPLNSGRVPIALVFLDGFFPWSIAAEAITRLPARFTDGDLSLLRKARTTLLPIDT